MSDAASYQQNLNLNYYTSLISFTVLYYEYFLTFPAEVTRMWAHGTWSAPTLVFYINRYVTFFGHLPIIVQNFWTADPPESKRVLCGQLHTYHQYFAILVQIMVGAMLIIRTYALYERDKKVLVVIVLYTVGASIHGFWAVSTAKSDEPNQNRIPYFGCPSPVGASLGERLGAAWIGILVFDTMIFLLTLYKALRTGRVAGNLIRLLLRDGTIYYGVLIVSNMGNILTFFLAGDLTRGILTTPTNVIASTLISRLMLNLRDPEILLGTTYSTTINGGRPTYPLLSSLGPDNTQLSHPSYSSRERGSRIVRVTTREEEIELHDIPPRGASFSRGNSSFP